MFYRLGLLAAVLGLSAPMTRLQSEVISSTVRLPKEPKHLRGNVYPISTTCPAIGNHGDPRGDDDPKTELEDAMEFLDQAKRHVDEAESAVFRRDWPAYDLARTNLYELAGGMWE